LDEEKPGPSLHKAQREKSGFERQSQKGGEAAYPAGGGKTGRPRSLPVGGKKKRKEVMPARGKEEDPA